jgi:ABC-type lipoprotein release transport system permease subunit
VGLLLTRFMASMFVWSEAFDPLTILGVSLLHMLVSSAASLAPALRAAHLDPYTTLHQQ